MPKLEAIRKFTYIWPIPPRCQLVLERPPLLMPLSGHLWKGGGGGGGGDTHPSDNCVSVQGENDKVLDSTA